MGQEGSSLAPSWHPQIFRHYYSQVIKSAFTFVALFLNGELLQCSSVFEPFYIFQATKEKKQSSLIPPSRQTAVIVHSRLAKKVA